MGFGVVDIWPKDVWAPLYENPPCHQAKVLWKTVERFAPHDELVGLP